MTITEYTQSIANTSCTTETTAYMLSTTHIWSNAASCGYCIKALQAAGIDRKTILTVLYELDRAHETITVPDAEQVLQDFIS